MNGVSFWRQEPRDAPAVTRVLYGRRNRARADPVRASLSGGRATVPKTGPPTDAEPGAWYALASAASVMRKGLSKVRVVMRLANELYCSPACTEPHVPSNCPAAVKSWVR